MKEHFIFWDSTVFASIVGGFIAGLTGAWLVIFQNNQKKKEEKEALKDADFRRIISISDYLTETQKDLDAIQNESCPAHVVLPFIKQIEFADYKDKDLSEIRKLYNLASLKIHALEHFLVIQGPANELGTVGREAVSQRHKVLRNEILKIIQNLMPKIKVSLEGKVTHDKK